MVFRHERTELTASTNLSSLQAELKIGAKQVSVITNDVSEAQDADVETGQRNGDHVV